MDNRCCRPRYPPKPPPRQSWEIILSNFAKVLPAPHLHVTVISLIWSCLHATLNEQISSYCGDHLSPLSTGEKRNCKTKMEAIGFFILSKHGHRKLLLLFFVLFFAWWLVCKGLAWLPVLSLFLCRFPPLLLDSFFLLVPSFLVVCPTHWCQI